MQSQIDKDQMNKLVSFAVRFRKPIQAMQETIPSHQFGLQVVYEKFE